MSTADSPVADVRLFGMPLVKGHAMPASLRITPADPFPEDLEELKDEKLQVLDSQV